MENKYFDYLKVALSSFDTYSKSVDFPAHSMLVDLFMKLLKLDGAITYFYTFGLIDADGVDYLRHGMRDNFLRIFELLNGRARWTAERLEDFLGEDASIYRVTLNVYNDLLSSCFFGNKFDFIIGKKNVQKSRC